MERSFVVTGAGGGVGRALVDRLVADGGVVALDVDEPALAWIATHPAAARIVAVCGDATDESVTEEAADRAESLAPLAGWVNNAAVFRDAALHTSPAGMVLEIITANLALTLVGCATAVRRLLAAGHGGAIVNVSSHQGQRPVRGAMPYATAKGAVESLTRALAVDHGPDGIRVNAVALGSISTERYESFLAGRGHAVASQIEPEMARLHPLGGSADRLRWLRWSRTCSPPTPRSSPARSSRSMADGPCSGEIPRRRDDASSST